MMTCSQCASVFKKKKGQYRRRWNWKQSEREQSKSHCWHQGKSDYHPKFSKADDAAYTNPQHSMR